MSAPSRPIAPFLLHGLAGLIGSAVATATRDNGAWEHAVDVYGLDPGTRTAATQLVDALPELASRLADLAADPLEFPVSRVLCSLALSYALFPFDILPQSDESLGLYGLLDDAVIAMWTLQSLEDAPPSVRSLLAAHAPAADEVCSGMPSAVLVRLEGAFSALSGQVLSSWGATP